MNTRRWMVNVGRYSVAVRQISRRSISFSCNEILFLHNSFGALVALVHRLEHFALFNRVCKRHEAYPGFRIAYI